MLHHHVVEVSMESTSVYWIPIWRVLSPHFKLNLANPYFIKQLPGRKSDVKDTQWIAECTMKELIRGSFVPPETIQQLRQYDRRIFDLNEEIVKLCFGTLLFLICFFWVFTALNSVVFQIVTSNQQNIKKKIMMVVGACIFLVAAAQALPLFFGL